MCIDELHGKLEEFDVLGCDAHGGLCPDRVFGGLALVHDGGFALNDGRFGLLVGSLGFLMMILGGCLAADTDDFRDVQIEIFADDAEILLPEHERIVADRTVADAAVDLYFV